MSTEKKIRVWRVSKESTAGIEVTDKSVVIAGSRNNFIAAHENGITVMGKAINFATSSENQRHGGMFVKMNDFVKMVPTTITTPMPDQIPWPPFGLASSLMKDLPFFLGMLTAGAVATQILKDV